MEVRFHWLFQRFVPRAQQECEELHASEQPRILACLCSNGIRLLRITLFVVSRQLFHSAPARSRLD